MIKVDWLAAGVLLIPFSLDWSMIKYAGVEFANSSCQWKQGPNFDQIYADNLV